MALSSSEIFNTTGIHLPKDACVVIVRTAWNKSLVDRLEAGCTKVLEENNLPYTIIEVPGAIELIFGIMDYWRAHQQDAHKPWAVIALGCVIKGDTPHFEYVCNSVTQGITQLNLQLPIPVIFGMLTVMNEQQAFDRLGGSHGHKGEEAASTAIKMMALSDSYKK